MRKLIGTLVLSVLFSGLALANGNSQSHTVTVKVPPVLAIDLNANMNANDFLFDFEAQGGGELVVDNTSYPRATYQNYLDFLGSDDITRHFAPTSVGGTNNLYGTLSVKTNQGAWTLKISSITGTLHNPLSNNRVKVFLKQTGGSPVPIVVGTPTPISQNLTLAQISSGGAGKRTFNLYYLLEMNATDIFPATLYNGQITVTYQLTSP